MGTVNIPASNKEHLKCPENSNISWEQYVKFPAFSHFETTVYHVFLQGLLNSQHSEQK